MKPTVAQGLHSEFGQVLARLVDKVAGARGAVLCDNEGHAVDFAHRLAPPRLSASTETHCAIDPLELQIAGAQCANVLFAIAQFSARWHLGHAHVLLEATHGNLVGAATAPDSELALVLVLARRAHLGAALRHFAAALEQLAPLLV